MEKHGAEQPGCASASLAVGSGEVSAQLSELRLVLVLPHVQGDGKGGWCDHAKYKAPTSWMGAAVFHAGKTCRVVQGW